MAQSHVAMHPEALAALMAECKPAEEQSAEEIRRGLMKRLTGGE